MADVAHLGLAVKYSDVDQAKLALDQMSSAAKKAEAEAMRFASASQRLAATTSLAAERAARAALADERLAAARVKVATVTRAAEVANSQFARSLNATAFQSRQLSYQLIDMGQAIPLLFQSPLYAMQNLGFQVAQIGQLYMGQGGLNAAIRDSARQLSSFTTGALTRFPLVTAAVLAGSAAVAGMTYEINAAGSASVTFGDVALANFQVIRDGVMSAAASFYEYLRPAVEALSPIFASVWDQIISGFKLVNNSLIAGWLTAFDAIKTGVMALPDAFVVAGEAAANAFLDAIHDMARSTLTTINDLISRIREATAGTAFEGVGRSLPMLQNRVPRYRVDLGGDAASKRLSGTWDGFKDRTADRFSTDYLGTYYQNVRKAAEENARLRRASEDAEKAAKDSAKETTDAWDGLRKVSPEVRQQMRELERQAEATARAWDRFGDGALDIFGGLITKTMDWREALRSAIPLVQDLIQGLARAQGGNTGTGNIWSSLASLLGGAGGGFSAKAFAGIGQGLFANGAAFNAGNVIPFARGGVVSQPTVFPMANGAGLMGEAGPEGILPLRRNSAGQLGVIAANANQPAVTFAPVLTIDARGSQDAAGVERAGKAIMDQMRREFTGNTMKSLREIKSRGLG